MKRIVYNTSFIINENIETEWIDFIKQEYIRVLEENDLCEDIIFTKVSIDQPEGKTYSLQIIFSSENQQEHFFEQWQPAIDEKIIARYKDSYLYFSCTLTEL